MGLTLVSCGNDSSSSIGSGNPCRVVFHTGEGQGVAPFPQIVAAGNIIELPGQENMTHRNNKILTGWKSNDGSNYNLYHRYAVEKDVDFTAQWGASTNNNGDTSGAGTGTEIGTDTGTGMDSGTDIGKPPKAPYISVKQDCTGNVHRCVLTWEKVEGATNYIIYRSKDPSSFTNHLNSTSLTSNITSCVVAFSSENGANYFLAMKTYNKYGYSELSNVVLPPFHIH
jgi:hypothetical protein